MKQLFKQHSLYLIAVIVLNTVMRYLPEDILYPIGRLYVRAGNWLCNNNLCVIGNKLLHASERFLWPDYAYFLGDAICYFLVAWYCYLRAESYRIIVCIVFVGLTVSNLLDELFFNPKKFEINELVTAAIVLLIAILKYKQLRRGELLR